MLRDLASKYYQARSNSLSKRADKTIGKFKKEEAKYINQQAKLAGTGGRRASEDPKRLRMIERYATKAESLIDKSEHMQSRAAELMRGK